MKYTEEEKQAIETAKIIANKKYGSIMCLEIKDVEIILNLVEKQQKEIERYKRIAEMNLKDGEEFKNEMCEHRCILKSEMKENYISKEAIRNKIEELEQVKYDEGKYDEKNSIYGYIYEFSKSYEYEVAQIIIKILKELLGE